MIKLPSSSPFAVALAPASPLLTGYFVVLRAKPAPIEPPPPPSALRYGDWGAEGAQVQGLYGSWHVAGAEVDVIYRSWS